MNPKPFKPARPTTYRGVEFKSRSEAIFARGLDLVAADMVGGMLWEYEPEEYRQEDNWVFDFHIISNDWTPGSVSHFAVEYKPAGPSPAYKKELWTRFDRTEIECALVVGCPFDPNLPRYFEDPKEDGTWSRNDAWLECLVRHWDEARKFRFDLESAWL